MRREIVLFRLTLVLAVVGFLVCAGGSTYAYFQADRWQEEIGHLLKGIQESEFSQDFYRQSFNASVAARDKYAERSGMLLQLAWVLPLTMAFVFYAGRWILLGRVRPLWPLKDQV